MISWKILDTGYCLASERHLIQGGVPTTVRCHALVALIYHPQRGLILWDTGYAQRMLVATQQWPWSLYRRLTPLRFEPALQLATQLPQLGIRPDSIDTIILSHLHADHVAGLRDFPQARIVLHADALRAWERWHGWQALRRAVVPALFPDDFAERAVAIGRFDGPSLPGLDGTHDLFGDGSLLLMQLPGHARGQLGLFLPTATRPVLFAADGAWLSHAIWTQRPPARVTFLFADDPAAIQKTLNGLHAFSLARPDVLIVPTHCPEIYETEVRGVRRE